MLKIDSLLGCFHHFLKRMSKIKPRSGGRLHSDQDFCIKAGAWLCDNESEVLQSTVSHRQDTTLALPPWKENCSLVLWISEVCQVRAQLAPGLTFGALIVLFIPPLTQFTSSTDSQCCHWARSSPTGAEQALGSLSPSVFNGFFHSLLKSFRLRPYPQVLLLLSSSLLISQ